MANVDGPDLLLINPGSRSQVYQALGSELAAIEPPVWAGLMATFARKRGFSIHLIDANAENLGPEETAKLVSELNPLLTAVIVYGHQPSSSTQNMPAAGATCSAIKQREPNLKVMLVGGHVASLPKRTLEEEEVDFVCGGEGPYSIVELISALKTGRPEEHTKVRGLWYWEGGTVVSNPPAPLVNDLDDSMPELAWDLLPMDKYRAHNWHCFEDLKRKPYASIYTTLGCPYHCSFCCIQAPFKSGENLLGFSENVNTYRFWSPESVIAQIDKLVNNYGVRNIKFADEMFVLNQRHVLGICDLIIERGYDLNIWAYTRVDSIKEEMMEKLKRAGVDWLCFGIESGHDRVLNDVDKGYEQERVYQIIEQVRASGINVIGNYIFGLPEDDLDSMQATLDLAMDLNCEFANFYSAMAYPGSQLYDLAVKEQWPLPEKWSGYSQHAVDTMPLPTKYLSGPEVLRFRDEAFQGYFNNPRYIEMIGRKFGPETLRHVKDMASYRLERLYT